MTSTPERVSGATPDMRDALLARLRDAAPEAFLDGRLDLDTLARLVGQTADSSPERYALTWPGKRDAIAMLQAPTRATLAPDGVIGDGRQPDHALIEGNNLEVLKVLHRSYQGRVKLIYIDPPYNTGEDFIYPDDFADPLGACCEIAGARVMNGLGGAK